MFVEVKGAHGTASMEPPAEAVTEPKSSDMLTMRGPGVLAANMDAGNLLVCRFDVVEVFLPGRTTFATLQGAFDACM